MKELSLIFIILIFYSCNKKQTSAYDLGKVNIDSAIREEMIYDWLDSQKDFGVSERKRSSNAIYYWKDKNDVEIPPTYFWNNCRAYFFKDSLIIRIGSTSGYTDEGIIINYKNGKYYSVPFKMTDIITEAELKRKVTFRDTFFLRNRRLILDKRDYKLGDSIFGRIHLEVEQPPKKNKVIEHFSDGYFRAKIEPLNNIYI